MFPIYSLHYCPVHTYCWESRLNANKFTCIASATHYRLQEKGHRYDDPVAQLVEQWPFKPTVAGSIPAGVTQYAHQKDSQCTIFFMFSVPYYEYAMFL